MGLNLGNSYVSLSVRRSIRLGQYINRAVVLNPQTSLLCFLLRNKWKWVLSYSTHGRFAALTHCREAREESSGALREKEGDTSELERRSFIDHCWELNFGQQQRGFRQWGQVAKGCLGHKSHHAEMEVHTLMTPWKPVILYYVVCNFRQGFHYGMKAWRYKCSCILAAPGVAVASRLNPSFHRLQQPHRFRAWASRFTGCGGRIAIPPETRDTETNLAQSCWAYVCRMSFNSRDKFQHFNLPRTLQLSAASCAVQVDVQQAEKQETIQLCYSKIDFL